MRRIFLVCLLLLHAACNAETALVAVASNLSAPMAEIAGNFKLATGHSLKVTYGASGKLARRIAGGVPFELFISADEEYVDYLSGHGVNVDARRRLVRGTIGVYIPGQSLLKDHESLDAVINALVFGSYRKIALADPEHAPYGVAARQALQSAGLWALENRRLIMVESAVQIIPFAVSWNVDAAIIPPSFLKGPRLAGKGKFYLFPEAWYEPIIQYAALLEGAGKAARAFYEYLESEEVGEVFARYGYEVLESRDLVLVTRIKNYRHIGPGSSPGT